MNKDRNIDIMGIVNLTDDSYFAQSRCAGVDAAMERVETLICEGADILDFGACSTRPGSVPVGPQQEWSRLEPVLREVRQMWPDVRISVDTWWSEVVSRTYDLIGDFIVNDISAGEDDNDMLATAGSLGLTYIAMHKRGTSLTMQQLTDYDDVVADVIAYFESFAQRASKAGIRDWIVDPGFGFAKTIEQNYQLLSGLQEFSVLDRPLLVGVSRKSMIYRLLGINPEEALPATQVLHLKALQSGADILRVHDVAETARTIALYRQIG
jgi:dihydropteroate synthase